jgi:hypothetical protein
VTLATLALLVAQLSPEGGTAPLPSNAQYVPAPPSGKGFTIVTLPASLAPHRTIRVRHGTEIYRLPLAKVTWADARGTRTLTLAALVGVHREATDVTVETIGGTHVFPSDAQIATPSGSYTLVFFAPGARRSLLLRNRTPDYVVP